MARHLVSAKWFIGVMHTPRDPSDPRYNRVRDFEKRIRPADLLPKGLTDKEARRALDVILHGPITPFTPADIEAIDLDVDLDLAS